MNLAVQEGMLPGRSLAEKLDRAAGKRIRHVHLADSQRQQPGAGHTNFRAAFRALRDVDFSDYMALECGLRGRPGVALAECVRFLKKQLR